MFVCIQFIFILHEWWPGQLLYIYSVLCLLGPATAIRDWLNVEGKEWGKGDLENMGLQVVNVFVQNHSTFSTAYIISTCSCSTSKPLEVSQPTPIHLYTCMQNSWTVFTAESSEAKNCSTMLASWQLVYSYSSFFFAYRALTSCVLHMYFHIICVMHLF